MFPLGARRRCGPNNSIAEDHKRGASIRAPKAQIPSYF